MKRVYLSGAQKRKKGEVKEKEIFKLQKISDFCTLLNKETQAVPSTSNLNIFDIQIIEEANTEPIDPSGSLIPKLSNLENNEIEQSK
ncbi:unnamed protein product [Parnassius mnemosyne]|uniref:Uncharacterized protein n=1 Tax=Parnassius mnemosyne TaxID=213953 RepID=A0AAV1KTA1_9NEOP